MHNLSDDELDRLSREAAGQNNIPAGDTAWDKIAARLDKEMPSSPGFNYHIIPDLAFLLLLIIGLPLLLSLPSKQPAINIDIANITSSSSGSTQPASETKIKSPKTSHAAQPIAAGERNPENTEVNEIQTNKKTGSKISVPGISTTDKNALVPVTDNRNSKLANKNKPGGVNDVVGSFSDVANGKSIKETARENDNRQPGSFDLGSSAPEMMSVAGPAALQNKSAVTEKAAFAIPDDYPEIVKSSLRQDDSISAQRNLKKIAEDQQAAAAKAKKYAESKSIRLLELGIVWSPDISKVGSAKAKSVGNILGFTASVNLNKRWSIQSGVLYSNKYYTALNNEYKKIPGYNTTDPWVKITKVQAECFMWDIPVNVRYNWFWRPSQRAFVSTGLSSYFMKKEDLHYWYEYYNNPRYKAWVNNESSNYWFSVMNISAGFEQKIIEGLTVQAEPFFKFSVRDVGYGNINLRSYGIFLGLKYIPPLHRSKK